MKIRGVILNAIGLASAAAVFAVVVSGPNTPSDDPGQSTKDFVLVHSVNPGTDAAPAAERPTLLQIPSDLAISQIYPNPFNSVTRIRFDLQEPETANLTILNILGQPVATLVNEPLPAGHYETIWNGSDRRGMNMPTGIYFVRLSAGYRQAVAKVILAR